MVASEAIVHKFAKLLNIVRAEHTLDTVWIDISATQRRVFEQRDQRFDRIEIGGKIVAGNRARLRTECQAGAAAWSLAYRANE